MREKIATFWVIQGPPIGDAQIKEASATLVISSDCATEALRNVSNLRLRRLRVKRYLCHWIRKAESMSKNVVQEKRPRRVTLSITEEQFALLQGRVKEDNTRLTLGGVGYDVFVRGIRATRRKEVRCE